MKIKSHFLACIPCSNYGKESPTRDIGSTENASAQATLHSPGFRSENKSSSRHYRATLLRRLISKQNKSSPATHSSHEAPVTSNHLNNPPEIKSIHPPTLDLSSSMRAVDKVEKQVVESIKECLSKTGKDTLRTSEFKSMVKHCVDDGLDALDQEFDQVLQKCSIQEIIPEQELNQIESAKERAKECLIQLANETCRSEGWSLPVQEESNLTWELPTGPLLIKRGLSLQQLTLYKADIASGIFGSVSIFKNENADQLIGKISKHKMRNGQGGIKDDLANELKAYQFIYEAVGPHPNLVNVYGIAQVPDNGAVRRTMLMDAIPGPNGKEAFHALCNCRDAGKISNQEYWGAIQFVGRRLLDVTEHLGKAGVVHNDITTKNFLVHEETGEPVLIDLGTWSKSGEVNVGGSVDYTPPEVENKEGVDERSDVFTVGASLLAGVEDGRVTPNEGLHRMEAFKNREGNMMRYPGTYSMETRI